MRTITELPQDNYGRPGLSHMTIAGSLLHGLKEVRSTVRFLVDFAKFKFVNLKN